MLRGRSSTKIKPKQEHQLHSLVNIPTGLLRASGKQLRPGPKHIINEALNTRDPHLVGTLCLSKLRLEVVTRPLVQLHPRAGRVHLSGRGVFSDHGLGEVLQDFRQRGRHSDLLRAEDPIFKLTMEIYTST